jgi:hypothetical protein
MPNELIRVFSDRDLKKISAEPIAWFQVQFPQPISVEMTEFLHVSLNCFPVINRRLNELSASARQLINVIPLQAEELFLDIRKVLDRNGSPYKVHLYSDIDSMDHGHAVLRNAGVARFDRRDAKQHIQNLLELLRDESTAFRVIGTDMISSDLKNLEQAITRLESKVKEFDFGLTDTNYLLLRPMQKNDLVFIEFWSTNGAFANKIRYGVNLQAYKSKDIDTDSIIFVTASAGGKNRPEDTERVNIYRKALLTGGRLVTESDYKMLCYETFGDMLLSVHINKGAMNDTLLSNGLVRTIDIHLKLANFDTLNESELSHIKQDLLIKLEQSSSNIYPYRIFLS